MLLGGRTGGYLKSPGKLLMRALLVAEIFGKEGALLVAEIFEKEGSKPLCEDSPMRVAGYGSATEDGSFALEEEEEEKEKVYLTCF